MNIDRPEVAGFIVGLLTGIVGTATVMTLWMVLRGAEHFSVMLGG